MSQAKENTNHRKTSRAELSLLVFGIALLAFWGAARVESIVRSRTAVGEFNALELALSVSPDSTRGQERASREPEPISSLSDVKNVQTRSESSPVRTDVTLVVLRIPKIGLEVPVLEGTDSLTLNHAVGRIAGYCSRWENPEMLESPDTGTDSELAMQSASIKSGQSMRRNNE